MTTKYAGDIFEYPLGESEANYARPGDLFGERQFIGTTIVFCANCKRVRTHRLWASPYWDFLVRVAEREPSLYCGFCSRRIWTPVVVALAVARVVSKDAWR